MPTLAILDKDGVLTGYKTVKTEKAWKTRKGQVAVPDGCDLAPRRYRWSGGTFWPLPAMTAERPRPMPATEEGELTLAPYERRAIALGFLSLDKATGGALDEDTRSWANVQISVFNQMNGGVKP